MKDGNRSRRLASRPAGSPPVEEVERDVVRIGGMTLDALRAEWRIVFGGDPPAAFSKDLLARAITYHLQEQALGGLSPATRRLLQSLSKPGAEPPRQVKTGSVIVREYKGVLNEVMVTPGGFLWQGQTWDSLSAIAKKITGISWNGPRFFGLRTKRGGASVEADQASDLAGRSVSLAVMARPRWGRRSSLGSLSRSAGAP